MQTIYGTCKGTRGTRKKGKILKGAPGKTLNLSYHGGGTGARLTKGGLSQNEEEEIDLGGRADYGARIVSTFRLKKEPEYQLCREAPGGRSI